MLELQITLASKLTWETEEMQRKQRIKLITLLFQNNRLKWKFSDFSPNLAALKTAYKHMDEDAFKIIIAS